MKNRVWLSQQGLSLIEIMIASAIGIIAIIFIQQIFSKVTSSRMADDNRLSAKAVAEQAIRSIRREFSSFDGSISVSTDPATMSLTLGSGSSSVVIQTVCSAPPAGTPSLLGTYTAASAPDCPSDCPAGTSPRVSITKGGNTHVFPSIWNGLGGAMVCIEEYPPVRLVRSYGVSVYVAWNTRKQGTSADVLWEVNSAYLVPSAMINATSTIVGP